MNPPDITLAHEDIAARARAIWENAGRPEGRDTEYWLQAERELRESARVRAAAATERSPVRRSNGARSVRSAVGVPAAS